MFMNIRIRNYLHSGFLSSFFLHNKIVIVIADTIIKQSNGAGTDKMIYYIYGSKEF